jgi:hypothetical protein
MKNRSLNEVLYPPVVVAHLSKNLGNLVAPHIKKNESIEVYVSSQPNSHPHLGTLTTISSAFALAHHLKLKFGLKAKVTLEALDNAPTLKKEINGFTYFKPMCFAIEGNDSLANKNLQSFKHFMDEIEKKSSISYDIKKYSEMQKSFEYRKKLLKIMDHQTDLVKFLNPTEGNIRLRSVCPFCYYGEKSGKLTKVVQEKETLRLFSTCFDHGAYNEDISLNGENFVDLNTPVRSVIRKALLMDDSKKNNSLKIMVDGADWMGMSQQLLPCLGILGYSIEELPIRFFSPLIEDWAGSKFSKSAYVKKDTYNNIPKELCDYSIFKSSLEGKGTDLIWNETLEWVSDSKKFFRNYTVDYFIQKWNLKSGN